jgi:hypothetical protein
MPLIAAFYWINEDMMPESLRVHHHNNGCVRGREIKRLERNVGTGGYRLCSICKELDAVDLQ